MGNEHEDQILAFEPACKGGGAWLPLNGWVFVGFFACDVQRLFRGGAGEWRGQRRAGAGL
jgi:hypothetical protein